jgi:hypothetical protein
MKPKRVHPAIPIPDITSAIRLGAFSSGGTLVKHVLPDVPVVCAQGLGFHMLHVGRST